jgi:hypothetical protein
MRYAYIDTLGQKQYVEAADPNAAIKSAVNRDPSSGVMLEPNIITSNILKPTTPINYSSPTPTPPPVIPTPPTPSNAPTMEDTYKLSVPEQQSQDLINELKILNQGLTGETAYRKEQETIYNIPELAKTQKDLEAQLKTLQNEASAIPLQLELQARELGQTNTAYQGKTSEALRENAIKALSVNSLLEASRGNLALANDLVDRAVSAKYDPLREELKVKMDNLNLIINSPEYTLAEKKRAAQQLEIQQQKELALQTQQDNQKNIYNIALEAAKNGADALTLQKIQGSKTPDEALRAASIYLQDKSFIGGGNASGDITPNEKPLTMWEIGQFKNTYGWTPPYGFTQSQLSQYMADNPNATPQQLEEGARKIISGGGGNAGSTNQYITEEYLRTNYTTDELKKMSDKFGTSKWYTPASMDISRFIKEAIAKVEEARQAGYSDDEIIKYLEGNASL